MINPADDIYKLIMESEFFVRKRRENSESIEPDFQQEHIDLYDARKKSR